MKAEMPERPRRADDGIAEGTRPARQTNSVRIGHTGDEAWLLIEQVVRRENLLAAYQRVVRNGGAPGVDGMTGVQLKAFCREHWARTRQELPNGTYEPQSGHPIHPFRRINSIHRTSGEPPGPGG